ncbi:MAG: hypothetical protein U9N84_01375 [Actinomycetota bacterium]|nr:hypothetical protein [Actinomycetota bacterium]
MRASTRGTALTEVVIVVAAAVEGGVVAVMVAGVVAVDESGAVDVAGDNVGCGAAAFSESDGSNTNVAALTADRITRDLIPQLLS